MTRAAPWVLAALGLLAGATACGDNLSRPAITVVGAGTPFAAALGQLVELTPYPTMRLAATAPAVAEGACVAVIEVAVDATLPAEGYRLEAGLGRCGQRVAAPDVLGAQYGVSHALENLGFRFRHPYDPLVPDEPALIAGAQLGQVHSPDIPTRGFQLHTIHPTEAYFATWEPGQDNLDNARRIVDWLIKNRGDYLQWVGLDDIMDPAQHAAWKTHSQALIEAAHARGVRVGLNIQLFGQSNLQRGFDLSDDDTGTVPLADELAARVPLVTDGLSWDVLDVSFGEFFDAEPMRFVEAVNQTAAALRAGAPQAEIHAVVHVGADTRVSYMGQDLIYYFLVKFADPAIVPDIHTVMFYNLYEDAGGAYHHDDFSEHRAYLLERTCAGLPVAYFPETAYWVNFDVSVPQYLPTYVRSRWLDLDRIAQEPGPCGQLPNHLLFSSGWEWGYWLNDVAALRASYDRPARYQDLITAEFATDLGPAAATEVAALADLQAQALIDQRLAAYVAGREVSIDTGDELGIVGPPDRTTFADLAAATPAARQMFADQVLAPLRQYGEALAPIQARLVTALTGRDHRWARELRDGVEVTAARVAFVVAQYEAALAHLAGDGAGADAAVARGEASLARGRAAVTARHQDLHDPAPERLLARGPTRTFYGYGYLTMADELCFWEREQVQVARVRGDTSRPVPDCLF